MQYLDPRLNYAQIFLSLFRHSHFSGSDGPPVQQVSDLLHVEHRVGLFVGRRDLEERLVQVRVKLLAQGVHLLEAIALEDLKEELEMKRFLTSSTKTSIFPDDA
jgi:hypothetical protein